MFPGAFFSTESESFVCFFLLSGKQLKTTELTSPKLGRSRLPWKTVFIHWFPKICYLKDPFEEEDIEGDQGDEDDDHADHHSDILSAVKLGALTPRVMVLILVWVCSLGIILKIT